MGVKKVVAGILLTVMVLENSLTALATPVSNVEVVTEIVEETEEKITEACSETEVADEEDSSEEAAEGSENGGEEVSSEEMTSVESETTEEMIETESVSETESATETEIEEENTTEAVTEVQTTEVLEEYAATLGETEVIQELDYILGRPMTELEIAEQEEFVPDYLPELELMPMEGMSDIDAGMSQISLFSNSSLPIRYDSREFGIITSVKNQYQWGTCWSFATMALMESSWLQQNDEILDLSERHLAYFAKNTGYDPLGNASEDTMVPYDEGYYLESGGNLYKSAVKMMNWHGAAEEAKYPYSFVSKNTVPEPFDIKSAQDIVVYPENVFFIPTGNASQEEKVNTVKKLIQTYGCVEWSYMHNDDYYNASTGAYYVNREYMTNHSITVVGWDDTYSKNNFCTDMQPENDGAWLVKNSWGESFGDEGYIYISYEDKSLGSGNPVTVMIAGDVGDFDNNYFYGNIVNSGQVKPIQSLANVYTIDGDTSLQKIKAVSFMAAQEKQRYSIQLYKNPDKTAGVVTNPASGTPLLTEPISGQVGYTGLYTVEIPEITVEVEDCISVVVTFESAGYAYFSSSGKTTTANGSTLLTEVNVTTEGESFYNTSTVANGWVDGASKGYSFLINLLTENISETVITPTLTYKINAPVDFTDTIACNFKWIKCSNALGYELYRAESKDGTYEKIADIRASERAYSQSIAFEDRDKVFYYKLAALYENGITEMSEPIPVDCSSVQLQTQIDFKQYMDFNMLEWKQMEGAGGYVIEKKTAAENDYVQLADIKAGETLIYKDGDVEDLYETVYNYRIRAYTEDGAYSDWKEWSTTDSISLSQKEDNLILVKWKKTNGVTYFRLRMDNVIWGKENASSMKITNKALVGETKKYRMEMYKSRNAFTKGELPVYVTPYVYYYAVPDKLKNFNALWDGEKNTFTWDASTTADTIAVYRSRTPQDMGDDVYTKLEGSVASYSDMEFEGTGMYYYWFVPQKTNSLGEMLEGEPVTAQIKVMPGPVKELSVTEKTENSVEISWKKYAHAEGYIIYRKGINDSLYEELISIDNPEQTTYEDADILVGKTYYYKVVARWGEEISDLENTDSVYNRLLPKTIRVAENGITYEEITIKSLAGLEYAIGTVGQNKTTLDYIKATEDTLTFTGLEPNSNYLLYVRTDSEKTDEATVYGPILNVRTFIKAELSLSLKDVVLSKGNKLPFTYTITPDNLHYNDKLEYTAVDEEGNECTVDSLTGTETTVVYGMDGKEICRISNGYFHATGESGQKEVYITVKGGSLAAEFHVRIHVPVAEMQMNVVSVDENTAVTTLDNFRIGQRAQLKLAVLPFNSDETIEWSVSNEKVAAVSASESDNTRAEITAMGTGTCVVTAISSDGVKTAMTIRVNKAAELYGIWVSDKTDLSGTLVEKDLETGEYVSEYLDKQPIFELNDTTASEMTVVSYVLADENGGAIRKAEAVDGIIYRSSDISVVNVLQDGTITAVGDGEADVIAYENNGNGIYGSCHMIVTGQEKEVPGEPGYPLDKKIKLSPVAKNLYMESFALDEKSSCRIAIKDQNGKVYSSEDEMELFTYSSAKPSICMVDEYGVVRPNPTYTGKTTTVKITAALKDDKAKRKVVYTVKVLAEKQIDCINLECVSASDNAEVTETKITEVFKKGATLDFVATAYDSKGRVVENPKLKYAVSDSKVAKVKTNKDGTVTVTMLKAGRVNLTANGNDVWKKATSIQIVATDTKPNLSKTSLSLNVKLTSEEKDGELWKASEDISIRMPDESTLQDMQIIGAAVGKKELTEAELANLAWVEKEDGSYHIAVEETYAKSLPKNAKLSVKLQAEVKNILLEQNVTENFTVAIKIISQEVKITVAEAKSINRFYKDKDESLLILKAPAIITKAEVLNNDYFTVTELKRGQWYLKFSDPEGAYNAKNAKLTLRLTADGYEPVEKKLTVQTPYKVPSLKQQAIPVLYLGNEQSKQAEIILYDQTNKVELSGYDVKKFDSAKLSEGVVSGSSFYVTLKDDVSFRNNEKVTAQIAVQAEKWKAPVTLKMSVTVSAKLPKIAMSSTNITLNKQAVAERMAVTLYSDRENTELLPCSEWNLQMYDAKTKTWISVSGEEGTDWLALSYDMPSQKLLLGIADGKTVTGGSYKFRISNVVEGFETVYKDFSVKVADVKPTVSISVKGKQDLINRQSGTLTGTLKLKNAIASKVENVVILSADGTDTNATYKAILLPNNKFNIRLTEAGMQDTSLKKQKVTLPVAVTLENGTQVQGSVSFTLTQANPKVKVPVVQTIYKSMKSLTREYDFASGLADGVALDRIEVVSVPKGFTAAYKDGSVVVTLNDRGIKAGTYQIKVNLFFEGAANGTKPVSKMIKVKVAE